MVYNAILLAATGFITWYAVSSFWSWYRMRHIPGPLLGSFSYSWVAQMALRGRGMDYEHLRKYGSIVRVSPTYVILDDPDDIRQINGGRNNIRRDDWYIGSKLDPYHDTLFSHLHPEPHDALKSKVAFAYSGRDNLDFEGVVDDQIMRFVDTLRERFLSKGEDVKSVDFAHFIRYFTLDIITTLGYGKSFGFMDAEGDLYGYTKGIEDVLGIIAVAADVPAFRRIFISPFLSKLFAPKPTDRKGVGKVQGIAHKIVDDRMDKDGETPDMIESFKRHGLDADEIKTETLVQIFAGSDTTATAIRSTMLYLMTCPRAYNRVKKEIKEAIAAGASHPITNDQAKKLPYLQAVIIEGLRMRPPVTYGFYKKLPPQGETFQGKHIPGGTAVGWNMPAMMRLEKVFGQDAQLFRPERFLECDEIKKTEMTRTVELTFGYGRWMCAGKVLAFIELNKIYFELLRAFDWQVVYPGKAWDEFAYTVYFQRHMWVSITEAT